MPDPTPAPVDPASPVVAAVAPVVADPAKPADPPANPAADPAKHAEPVKAAWPENWRETWAGDDPKKLARLQRFTDPAKAFDALVEAHNKIRAGEFAKPLPADATDEQKAEWRAANGVPDKVEAYFDKLPDGLVIGADDMPIMSELIGNNLLKHNVPPAVAHDIAKSYYDWQEKVAEERATKDKQEAATTIEALRDEWGTDFNANKAHVMSFLDGLGKDLKEKVMNARMDDGTPIFNNLDIVKWFAQTARELNPVGIIAPAGEEGQAASVDAEIAKLKGLMGNRNSEYWKGPTAEKNQARYRQLLEWQQNAQKKGRAA